MDTSEYPSMAMLAGIHAELAEQNLRVEAVVDSQLDGVERLFRAATSHDWDAVARASDQLARQPIDARNKAVIRTAHQVCEELRRDPSGACASRRLAELLSACRIAKIRGGLLS